jgi:hypothetical protein
MKDPEPQGAPKPRDCIDLSVLGKGYLHTARYSPVTLPSKPRRMEGATELDMEK